MKKARRIDVHVEVEALVGLVYQPDIVAVDTRDVCCSVESAMVCDRLGYPSIDGFAVPDVDYGFCVLAAFACRQCFDRLVQPVLICVCQRQCCTSRSKQLCRRECDSSCCACDGDLLSCQLLIHSLSDLGQAA